MEYACEQQQMHQFPQQVNKEILKGEKRNVKVKYKNNIWEVFKIQSNIIVFSGNRIKTAF